MLKAIVLDDDAFVCRLIDEYCRELKFITVTASFSNPGEAAEYLARNEVDMVFINPMTRNFSGIDFYLDKCKDLLLVFVSDSPDHAIDGFNLGAVDYLLKPLEAGRFKQAAVKCQTHFNFSKSRPVVASPFILIKVDYSLKKIFTNDIKYIESLDDYVNVHLFNSRPVLVRMTMKSMLDKLPKGEFVRVHRSFIVPIHRVESVRNKTIQILDARIPIGSCFEECFYDCFAESATT